MWGVQGGGNLEGKEVVRQRRPHSLPPKAPKPPSTGILGIKVPRLRISQAQKAPPTHLGVWLRLGAHDAGEGGRGQANGPVDLARHRLGDGIKDRHPAATQLGRPGMGGGIQHMLHGGVTTKVTNIPRVKG